ncbi:enoyl-CoA hydratase [Peribacillus sp. TH16]|uniref:enoyl-CoA hydratase n=1 Tax=Peribacillus sp. TH16 TaxID=2798482 RepID=UPI001912F17F|nr:enoyl-CoA hydratase [Peribacillus sp. TH16]MBK5484251.1 enoyl-CoA hydratase [Peribacillus sp. TH16]
MEYLKLSIENHVAFITINHAPANALSSIIIRELSQAFDQIAENENVRVVLLHGEGRFFSAGADIKEFTEVENGKAFEKLTKNGQSVFEKIESFPKPVIAAIHGAALGGGLELAMACHIRLVTERAKLGLPELQLGLIPGFAGTQRLPRYVGTAMAAEMLFTSEPITGLKAVQCGLANHAFTDEELIPKAKELAFKIAKKSPLALKSTIELLNYTKHDSYYKGVEREAVLFCQAFDTADAKEGIGAFIEKREAIFKGK